MKHSISSASRTIRGLLRDRAGAAAILFGFAAVGLMGTAGLTIDIGRVYAAKKAFNADTRAAAMAGAHALSQNNATLNTVTTAVTAWKTANPSTGVTVTNTAVSANKVTSNTSNGGGIFSNVPNVAITASTLSSNSAALGGGLYLTATNVAWGALIINSTLGQNIASNQGGGIYALSVNCALDYVTVNINKAAPVSAGGGGGGIYSNGSNLTFENTILAGGTTATGGNFASSGGTALSYGHNLSSDTTTNSFFAATDLKNVNPLLGPLASNGGFTLTYALLAGSPALNKSDGTGPTVDQRGAVRGNPSNIGAY